MRCPPNTLHRLFHVWFSPCSFLTFSALYAFKQTFAIPGSFIMNLAAGALFGTGAGALCF